MKPQSGGKNHGWPSRSVTLLIPLIWAASLPLDATANPVQPLIQADHIVKIGLALASILIVNAIIPTFKAWIHRRKLHSTYRNYLKAHVGNTLESFKGAGSTHFAEKHAVFRPESDWFIYLKTHDLGVPEIFLSLQEVIQKTLESDTYVPSVSYLGLDSNSLDHTSPVWELTGPDSIAALQYFLTQKQVETALDYQYSGWYFDLINSENSNQSNRERWCQGLENVLFDMAQHYKAARELEKALARKTGK